MNGTIEPVYCFIDSDGDVLGYKLMGGTPVMRKAVAQDGVLPYFARDLHFLKVFRGEALAYAKHFDKTVAIVRLGVCQTVETFNP